MAKKRKLGLEDFVVHSKYIKLLDNGILFIKKGYTWDGPSGPAIDSDNFMEGSLIHDVFYQIIRERLLINDIGYSYDDIKEMADRELYHIVLRNGMCKIRAIWVYIFVRFFGHWALKPYIKEIKTKII